MSPPDATPGEIGEFWDTYNLTDYWAETYEGTAVELVKMYTQLWDKQTLVVTLLFIFF